MKPTHITSGTSLVLATIESKGAVGEQKRRWESNPLRAALQAAASPSGSGVNNWECPRQESNLDLDLRRVVCLPHTPRTSRIGHEPASPARESDPALRLRRPPCNRHTHGESSVLARNRTWSATFGGSRAVPHTPRTLSWESLRWFEQGCKDSNPVGEFWRLVALPGAHPCLVVSLSSANPKGYPTGLEPAP